MRAWPQERGLGGPGGHVLGPVLSCLVGSTENCLFPRTWFGFSCEAWPLHHTAVGTHQVGALCLWAYDGTSPQGCAALRPQETGVGAALRLASLLPRIQLSCRTVAECFEYWLESPASPVSLHAWPLGPRAAARGKQARGRECDLGREQQRWVSCVSAL